MHTAPNYNPVFKYNLYLVDDCNTMTKYVELISVKMKLPLHIMGLVQQIIYEWIGSYGFSVTTTCPQDCFSSNIPKNYLQVKQIYTIIHIKVTRFSYPNVAVKQQTSPLTGDTYEKYIHPMIGVLFKSTD